VFKDMEAKATELAMVHQEEIDWMNMVAMNRESAIFPTEARVTTLYDSH
jgi:hypothetical protein